VDPDRVERLMIQVLEETRAFRQEMNDKFAGVNDKFVEVNDKFAGVNDKFVEVNEKLVMAAQERQALRRDLDLVQAAVLEISKDVRRVEAKLDETIANHGARLDKLEGAAE
jgi:chromosome segregation ATPase